MVNAGQKTGWLRDKTTPHRHKRLLNPGDNGARRQFALGSGALSPKCLGRGGYNGAKIGACPKMVHATRSKFKGMFQLTASG